MSNMSLKREIMQIIEETIKNDVTSEMLLMELYAVGIDSLKIIRYEEGAALYSIRHAKHCRNTISGYFD